MNMDHNCAIVEIETPQDEELARLGVSLNDTYVAFDTDGLRGMTNQMTQDGNSGSISRSNMASRAVTKSNRFYRNSNWDLVDAIDPEKVHLDQVKDDDLPENLGNMTLEQRGEHLQDLLAERKQLQAQINELNTA